MTDPPGVDGVRRRQLHVVIVDADRRAIATTASRTIPVIAVEWQAPESTSMAAIRAIRDGLEIPAILLELHGQDSEPGSALLASVDVVGRAGPTPRGCRWRTLDDPDPVVDPALAPRLTELLAEWRDGDVPRLRPAWARPGWFQRASDWITGCLAAQQRTPTGPIVQVKHWGLSAVMSVDTDRGPAWFKAVFDQFRHEPAVTALLDREQPGTVASVIAIEPEEGWVLLDDVGDESLYEHPDLDGIAISRLVTCQRTFVGRPAILRSVGCPARPFDALPIDVVEVLGDPVVRSWVAVDGVRLEAIVAWIRRAAADVAVLGFPDTLVHGDFHPENVVVGTGGPVIFDWSDAAVAHPLVDAMVWSSWLHEDPTRGEAAWRAFLEAWSDVCSIERAEQLRPQLVGLAAAYHTVSYGRILTGLEAVEQSDLASGLRLYFELLDRSVPPAPG